MYIDKNCKHLITQEDSNGDIAIWVCNLMDTGERDHEGNCGMYECPLGNKIVKHKLALNCPCCGGKAKTKGSTYNELGAFGDIQENKHWYGVYCAECLLGQPKRKYFTKEDAIAAWNNRCR